MPKLDPVPILGPDGAIARAGALRGAAAAAGDGRGGRAGDREARAPDGRGGDGGRQELRLPRPGDPGGGRGEEESRRLDAHDQPPGAIAPEGPAVPARGHAAGVLGRAGQGAGRITSASAGSMRPWPGPGRRSRSPRSSTSSREIRLWAGRTGDGSRSDLDFRPLPSVWDAVASENGNCLGRNCPRHKDCFYFKARRRMWSANILVVNHALFITDLALRAAGASLLPDYDVAIFDEAHTLEAVAGEHLGLKRHQRPGRVHARPALQRPHEQGAAGLSPARRGHRQVQRVRYAARDFFDDVAVWQGAHGATNGRLRKPIDWPDTVVEELRKLATAIGRGPRRSRGRSSGSSCRRRRTAATAWRRRSTPGSARRSPTASTGSRSSDGRGGGSTLACAPLDVGPTLRRELFERCRPAS